MRFKEKPLGDIAYVQGGYAFKSKDFTDEGDKVLKIKNVRTGYVDYNEAAHVSSILTKNLSQYKTAPDDILISMTGSGPNAPASVVGRVGRVKSNEPLAYINQRVGKIVLKDDAHISKRFLYYFLSQKRISEFLVSNSTGSANQANINPKLIESILIPELTYAESETIASKLSCLDDKIDNNKLINKSLEKIAQALFKSWFVDFDPVKAKIQAKEQGKDPQMAAMMAISGKKQQEIQQLPQEKQNELAQTASLFPDKLMESELGLIPKGWNLKLFGELLDKTIGGDWGKEEPDEKHTEQVMIIRGTDIPTLQKGGIEKVPIRFVESKKLKTRKLQEGDIVIEVSGGSPTQPTGRSILLTNNIINRLNNVVEPASFCRLFRPKTKNLSYYLSQHLLYIYADGKTWLYQNQSTGISNFQTNVFLEKELIPIPNRMELLTEFKKRIAPMIFSITSNENIKLSEIRDNLLPQLLSGDFKLKD